jgi:t-SNARE complex subunit (syntaxin)
MQEEVQAGRKNERNESMLLARVGKGLGAALADDEKTSANVIQGGRLDHDLMKLSSTIAADTNASDSSKSKSTRTQSQQQSNQQSQMQKQQQSQYLQHKPYEESTLDDEEHAEIARDLQTFKQDPLVDIEMQFTKDVINDRKKRFTRIEKDVVSVKEMFTDLNDLVQKQQTFVDDIENNIVLTKRDAEDANEELELAAKHQAEKRRRMCSCMFLLLLAVIAFILLFKFIFSGDHKPVVAIVSNKLRKI